MAPRALLHDKSHGTDAPLHMYAGRSVPFSEAVGNWEGRSWFDPTC